jgi:CTD nuclear envelope phosphatase 1
LPPPTPHSSSPLVSSQPSDGLRLVDSQQPLLRRQFICTNFGRLALLSWEPSTLVFLYSALSTTKRETVRLSQSVFSPGAPNVETHLYYTSLHYSPVSAFPPLQLLPSSVFQVVFLCHLPMPHGLFAQLTMNSLNIITTRVSPTSSPAPSRSNSLSHLGIAMAQDDDKPLPSVEDGQPESSSTEPFPEMTDTTYDEKTSDATEDTSLLSETKVSNKRSSWWHALPRNFASSILGSIRWVFVTLASPGVYLIACFCDANGNFAPWTRIKSLFGGGRSRSSKLDDSAVTEKHGHLHPSSRRRSKRHSVSNRAASSSSAVTSESEADEPSSKSSRHTRSKSLDPSEEINPARKSIRIKLHNEEGTDKRRHRKTQSAVARTKASDLGGDELSAHLKSPTSPVAALTKYPRAPAPPRPLIPRRQPSYLNIEPTSQPRKTLILDLDETLIHSMSKGGRMSTGHMVEVRLNAASLGMGGQSQHPILYWVNKRPYCDEFLRRVCKWFNLVIFTASVQEYADPVIDWLETERKFFSARYYRQHCTYRQGAYIKDLSSVDPDLSNVMILDNSPLSYLFHEGNRSWLFVFISAMPFALTLTDRRRQRDSHPRLDQRPHGL